MSAAGTISKKQRLKRIIFFFPFQLVLLHLKKNYILLLFWLLLFGLITQQFATKFGIPQLFLYPEYLGKVNFTSHLILGFAVGGFIMAFNISSYIMNGFRFPFIATLSRPFIKYCINNFIIPFLFFATYLHQLYTYQYNSELESISNITFNLFGFITGNLIFIVFTLLYFAGTNKSIAQFFDLKLLQSQAKSKYKANTMVKDMFYKKEPWYKMFSDERSWEIETYLSNFFKIGLARESKHYDKSMLKKVFEQNHINASLFELAVIFSILFLGYFKESAYMVIPAGASVILLLTMFLMLSSALHSWLKGWATFAFILLFLTVNYFSQFAEFNYMNKAYGVDYTIRTDYTTESINATSQKWQFAKADSLHAIKMLENWKRKFAASTTKPKLIILNTTGGGLRSAMWTFSLLQKADSILESQFSKHTHFIFGSSGGMIGAAFYRELLLQHFANDSIKLSNPMYRNNMGMDILNPLAYYIAVNDLFIRYDKFEENGNVYRKDRGYIFEKQLIENTNYALSKTIAAYQKDEEKSVIPSMVFTPTIVNDGRRLLISSQPVSFLSKRLPNQSAFNTPLIEGIEFMRFFKNHNPENLKLITALRMSATFPYVMPNTSLPTTPLIEVMDAGMRDNNGMVNTLKFLFTFNEWIKENTSGVIICEFNDSPREIEISENPLSTLVQYITRPVGNFYTNWLNIQKYTNEDALDFVNKIYDNTIQVIAFDLRKVKEESVSISWHLTGKEKLIIENSLRSNEVNQKFLFLKDLLSTEIE